MQDLGVKRHLIIRLKTKDYRLANNDRATSITVKFRVSNIL
jgi:hypothetical protein